MSGLRGRQIAIDIGLSWILSLVKADFPPFPTAVINQVRHDTSPQSDETVMNRYSFGVTGLQTFHVVRHQKCKWHVIPHGIESWAELCAAGRLASIRFFRSNS